MESISSLRSILISTLTGGDSQDGEQELFDELSSNKKRLLNVFDFGPRNAEEQREIESGKVTVDGRSLSVNAEFARHVAFISQQVNCSERFVAAVLHYVLSKNPTIDKVEAVEQSVLAYHQLRRELADCLRFVFETAAKAEEPVALPIHALLNDFVRRQLIETAGHGSITHRIFVEIVNLDTAIAAARIAVTNAVSTTNIPGPQAGNANLGQPILQARLESLLYERRNLAIAFYFIARSGYLASAELCQVLEWLINNPKSEMALYILSAFFASLDLSHSQRESRSAQLRISITKDAAVVSFVKAKLAPTTEWKDTSLKAAVSLKWTLFLAEVRYRDTSLEHVEGFRNEDLTMQVFNAIQADAFSFLLRIVSQLNADRSVSSQLLTNSIAPGTAIGEANEANGSMSNEFKGNLLHEIELLLRSLLTHAPAELRKVKHKQEDQFRPRADRHARSGYRPTEPSVETSPPRNDIAILFQLLGQLYSVLPEDSAIQFWGGAPRSDFPEYYEVTEAETGRLPSFLRWAVEVREPDLIICVFDMLAGLSTGVACAECAYNFMAMGSLDVVHGVGLDSRRYEAATVFTWRSIFGELESWSALGTNQRPQHGVAPAQLQIAPTDVLLGLAFLKFTAAVAEHSVQARIAIATHPQYRTISCLVSLIPLGVPLELKGAIFETLSAFCHPGAGMQGVDICKNVWAQMERLEVINVRGGGFASKGVEVELEEVESVHRVYPATIAFLELLCTLIHTPKRVPLKNRVTEPEPVNTVPENFGQPYRTLGIGPYVSFVVDNVLAKLPRREFLAISDSWKMADLSFCFLERCLASYDLESLPGLAEEYTIKGPEVLTPLVHHPGFDVLSRMLSETQLRTTLLTYVVEGAEELPRQPITSRFINVILRVLRIADRVLEIEDLFLDHLVPAVSDFDDIVIAGTRVSQSFLSRIGQGLSLDRRSIPAIGSYATCLTNSEIKYMAVKILSSLSQSPSFQSIASLIERSQESTIILDGFVDLLGNDSTDDASDAEEWADLWTGAGAPDLEGEQDLFAQAIQLAILDLLLRGTKRSKSSSLAFLLLFGKTSPDGQVQDPHALGSRELCLHVILKLLNRGIPRLTEKSRDRERYDAKTPLFESQPVLAERLYKLVYQLCEHPRTSAPMMLYLRTREDFFARHLAAMAVHAPTDNRAPVIEVAYNDGSRVVTTCTSAKAFLQLHSWLLDLVSLELHVLTNKGQNQRVKELLDLLFGTTETYHGPETDWEHDMFQPFNDVGQSRIRIIEIFQSLEFEWYDSVTVTPVDLQFYGALNLQSCIRTDESGCEVVDRAALFELLSNARRVLVRQGQVVNALHSAQLDAETKYVLESCVVENNRREVQFALGLGYESWKKLLDVVLTKCFNRISHDQRENILFDLLHVVPPAIHNNALPESSATLLAESLLLLVTKLREERKQVQLLSASDSMESSALPVERMAALLRHILDCILESHRGDLVRGNLYAALINFVHLAAPLPGNPAPPKHIGLSREASLSNLTSSLSLLGSDVRHANGHSTSLEANCFAVIKPVMERLITTISKDAIDGTEVWKTIAFTLLESLTRMSHLDSRNSIFNTLDRYGLLSNFVHSIGEANSTLQDVLQPEPDDLNPLYVYETKVTFFIRLSQSRQGSERLLESRILPVLSHVDFLDSRPEPGDSALDHDSFLPSTLSRYHQLFVPALQLATGLVATLGSKHAVVSKQILDFIHSHRDTLVIMLKQDASLFALSSIQELDLIISLCALVVPSVPQTDFVATNSGFGSLHNAILAVAARILGSGRWLSLVRPSDETEAIESNMRGSEYGVEGSKFDHRVRQVTQSLRRSTVNYLSVASSILDAELIVVLSPTLTPRDERTSVALPSLKDAIDFLDNICDELLGTMQEIVDAASELERRDHIRVDRIEELVDDVEPDVLRKLDINQRRAFVCRILERSIASRRAQVESILSTVEILLHLLWRHLCYYASGQAPSGSTFDRQRPFSNPQPSLSASQAHLKTSTLRFLSMPDVQSFRSEASAFLTKILEKVDGIELSEELAGRSWRSSQTYLEIMSRCLREAVATGAPSPDDRRE
ncbi:uncharacterized protein FOMMEDRAFT_153883 [Fomitiporia mediterranea MF3/22]|uniref:uncharacterized protein n=1 Tax=Fomitiporia mediterranea (strain MF3/22) TaxID=694068 RepID=UPI0004407A8E|nr:uncharacterized protein FOMMEDRAFT_153883 [Fomitiporia mediterranea MF3/22]EJD04791.1 hypothetical protein FOMMEDRAFT_153883 [Fomitiporia mediterranea MF3/22]